VDTHPDQLQRCVRRYRQALHQIEVAHIREGAGSIDHDRAIRHADEARADLRNAKRSTHVT